MGKDDAFGLAIAVLETEDLDVLPVEDVGEDLVGSKRFRGGSKRNGQDVSAFSKNGMAMMSMVIHL
jgi:hypothetical protein